MPRTLADIFAVHSGVEALEVVSSDDGGPYGLYDYGRRLKLEPDYEFARELARLPNANTESGHILELDGETFCVRGSCSILDNSYKALVVRRVS